MDYLSFQLFRSKISAQTTMHLIFTYNKQQWKQRQQTEKSNSSSSLLPYSIFPWLRWNQAHEFKAEQEKLMNLVNLALIDFLFQRWKTKFLKGYSI